MISDEQLAAAALLLEPPTTGHLSTAAQSQLLTYIRSIERYRLTPGLFPDLVGRLAAVTGFDAQFLQAVLSAAKASGTQASQLSQFSSIKVDKITLSINDKASFAAYSFFDDALNFLYAPPAQRSAYAVVQMSSRVTICSLHHINYSLCGCNQTSTLVF
jgi:hypothetical protein